ncbi:MAG: putative DNA binding domain-containing protein, partial [Proteobacteria bacterium]|nr:putative DNA binding domain-containing protein [Pseudomonadota bacterium]
MFTNLAAILTEGESSCIEFKETADKSLASEVCAFANASGGRIFIGVGDDGQIVGTDTSNSARSRIQDTVNQIEPRLDVEVSVHENIVVVTVPEGTNKPYACAKGFFLRTGPNSQKLERDSIVEFFQNEEQVRYDEIVRKDLPVSDKFDESAYALYVRKAGISNVLDKETILENLNCAARVGETLCFTNAGALFFRKNSIDVKFRHAGVVCALFKGVDKAIIIDAKEFNDDIVSNIDAAVAFLKRHLNVSFRIKSLQRENIWELPEEALREAIVNAVCHRNYFEKGARVMVEIFDDRVDIVSPGGVCKGINDKNFGKLSISRNSVISSMLYRIDYIEQMGTGIERMRRATRFANVTEPQFTLNGFFVASFRR